MNIRQKEMVVDVYSNVDEQSTGDITLSLPLLSFSTQRTNLDIQGLGLCSDGKLTNTETSKPFECIYRG